MYVFHLRREIVNQFIYNFCHLRHRIGACSRNYWSDENTDFPCHMLGYRFQSYMKVNIMSRFTIYVRGCAPLKLSFTFLFYSNMPAECNRIRRVFYDTTSFQLERRSERQASKGNCKESSSGPTVGRRSSPKKIRYIWGKHKREKTVSHLVKYVFKYVLIKHGPIGLVYQMES